MNNATSTNTAHSLILGTVQLGQKYGIANTTGKPDQSEANAIIQTAWNGGVSFFDTAQGYGDSESVLGAALRQCGVASKASVVTKLSPTLPTTPEALIASVEESRRNLGVDKLYCLMLHRQEHLPLLETWLGESLAHVQRTGVAQHIGVSVYTPEAALEALAHPLIGVVQIPASIFDRRFEAAGVFAQAGQCHKELHIRSIFLQGVLNLEPENLPEGLAELKPALTGLRAACQRWGCSQLQGAMGWMLHRYPAFRCIFGAERTEQVRQNLDFAIQSASFPSTLYMELDSVLPPQKPELLNPALWRR